VTQTAPATALVRGLGLGSAISINVANMIGTGVFLKTRVMTCNVGSAWLVLLVWVAAGLLSLAGTVSYAEVCAMIPEAGGDYVYLRRAYGRWVGFLYGWTFFTVARAGSQAALAVSFAIFLNVALGGVLSHDLYTITTPIGSFHLTGLIALALLSIWAVALINMRTVTTGGNTAIALTVLKVVMLLIIAIGALALAAGHWSHLGMEAAQARCEGVDPSAQGGVAGFGAAMLGALWAYDGWNNVTPLAGEIKDPSRNLPRAFFGGILVVGALYILINVGYFFVLSPTEIANIPASSSVATQVAQHFMGPTATTVTALILMISSLGSLHASVLANSRIPYAMAKEGLFFKALARVSSRTHVPINAIIAQAAWATILALSGSYDRLTDSVIFASWMFYGLSTGSLFIFRLTLPNEPRPYKAFGYPYVPAVFVLVTSALIVNTFYSSLQLALTGVGVMVLGLPFYWYWSRQLVTE